MGERERESGEGMGVEEIGRESLERERVRERERERESVEERVGLGVWGTMPPCSPEID